ncbi:MAG: RHS repeat-associated core domain-containing protein [Candidatus Peribacteraceae bacterium]|nr:RHS repeat-associated core domain-containing protein [Candidatus Peribacteraceae bacterium]
MANTYRYTPFGSSLIKDETVYNPYQFTGRRYDAESGMYYYRARMYEPGMGRFIQADPAGMVDGANMYAYVGNNPVNKKDPFGLLNMNNVYAYIVSQCIARCESVCKCNNVPNAYTSSSSSWAERYIYGYERTCKKNCFYPCLWDNLYSYIFGITCSRPDLCPV